MNPLRVLAVLLIVGCNKSPPVSGGALAPQVPQGCKQSPSSPRISCDDGSELSWLASPEKGVGSLDQGEKVIRDAMATVKTASVTREDPACTVEGAEGTCRHIHVVRPGAEMSMHALIAFVQIKGTPYYVECSYEGQGAPDAGKAVPAICTNLFVLR